MITWALELSQSGSNANCPLTGDNVVLIFGPSDALSIFFFYKNYMRSCECLGLLGGTVVKNPPALAGLECKRLESGPWVQKIPEEGMATHFSIPAQTISWTEEPGGLQSMESQRVRHN